MGDVHMIKAASRTEWIDVAKGMSILLVVLYHSTLMSSRVGFDVDALARFNNHLAPILELRGALYLGVKCSQAPGNRCHQSH
jgi:uncharacterized membrane protein YcfT